MSDINNQLSDIIWHSDAWARITRAYASDRLGHAPVLVGPRGMGKLVFGRRLAALLLCLDPPSHAAACGSCHGCRLHAAGNHPDYLELTVADGKTQISVDQVRDMSAHLALKSHTGGNKVALLWPAERMNANAANSLLKTLEEPPDATTLILCCSSLSALPATVVSRCQRIIFTRPPLDIALGWLESVSSEADWRRLLAAADGAPLAAVELHRSGYLDAVIAWQEQLLAIVDGSMDPCSIAAKWSRDDPRLVLRWLQRLVETGVCLNSGALDVNQVEESMDGRLQNVFANLNIVKLMEYLEWLRWLLHGIERPLNLQLAFEGVLIPWSQGLRLVQQVPGGSV